MKTTAIIIVLACWFTTKPAFAVDDAAKIFAAFPTNSLDYMGYPTNAALALARGEADARRDWSNDVLTLKFAGLPSPAAFFYWDRLKKHCGVTIQPLAGCDVTEGLDNYIKGYNKYSSKQIEQKFGTNIFTQLHELAEADLKEDFSKSAREHKIRAGDTLAKIARQHGVTLKDLKRANPDVDANRLKIGAVLKIPTEVQPKPAN